MTFEERRLACDELSSGIKRHVDSSERRWNKEEKRTTRELAKLAYGKRKLTYGKKKQHESTHEPSLKPFSKYDWYAYAGAEKPDSGGEPLIGPVDLSGVEGTLIVSRNGVQIMVDDPSDGVPMTFHLDTPFAQGRAIAAQVIRTKPPVEELEKLGFMRIAG